MLLGNEPGNCACYGVAMNAILTTLPLLLVIGLGIFLVSKYYKKK